MEQSRKHLKISSIVVLIFVGVSILNLLSGFIDLNGATIPEDAPENILAITKTILSVIAAVLLLPQIYIGFKGLKMASNPDSSKSHIVVAAILLGVTILTAISPITALVQKVEVFENVRYLLSLAVEAMVFFDYIKYAKIVADGN